MLGNVFPAEIANSFYNGLLLSNDIYFTYYIYII